MLDNTPQGTADNAAMSIEDAAASLPDSLFDFDGEYQDEDGADEGEKTKAKAENSEGEEPEENEAEEAEEDEADEQSDKSPKIKLKGGEFTLEEIEGKFAELEKGALRQADYTRKQQELSEARKGLEVHAQRISQAEADFKAGLALVESILSKHIPTPPDQSLLRTDPVGFIEAKEAYDRQIRDLRELAGVQERQTGRQKVENSEAHQKWLREEQAKLHERVPEFRTREGQAAFMGDVRKFGEFYGLTTDEVAEIGDHRALAVLKDAIAFRKLQAAKPEAVKTAKSQPLKPSARGGADTRTMLQAKTARSRFMETRSVEDAAAAIPDSWVQ